MMPTATIEFDKIIDRRLRRYMVDYNFSDKRFAIVNIMGKRLKDLYGGEYGDAKKESK